MSRRFLLVILLFFWTLGGASVPILDVQAQEQCGCWCSTSQGAVQSGVSTKGSFGPDCSKVCQALDGQLLGCTAADEKPPSAARCWTQSQCENDEVILGDGSSAKSIWSTEVTPECPGPEHSDSGQEERHCFAPNFPVTLNVAIDTLTTGQAPSKSNKEVFSLAQYVDALYRLLIQVGALIAVVIIMIAGMQYMLAAGNQTAIGKAKDRIGKAIAGLVLLLFAYTIIVTVDPRLANLEIFKIPRVRPVLFLDPNASCENLEQFFDITPITDGEECGDKGRIGEQKEGVTEDITGDLKEGDECNYARCDEPAKRCVQAGGANSDLFCARCADSYIALDGEPNPDAPVPTVSNCALFNVAPVGHNIRDSEEFICRFDNFGSDECIEVVYPQSPSAISFDCNALRADARAAGTESCRAYDTIGLLRTATVSDGYAVDQVDDFYTSDSLFEIPETNVLKDMCEQDVCGLAQPGHSCTFYSSTLRADCLQDNDLIESSFSTTGLLDAFATGVGLLSEEYGAALESTNCNDVNGEKVNCQKNW